MGEENKSRKKRYVVVQKPGAKDIRDKNDYIITELKEKENGEKFIELADGDELTVKDNEIGRIYESPSSAKIGLRRSIYEITKGIVIERLKKDELPEEFLKPAFSVKITGNPLRFKERNLGPVMQANVFGSGVNEQKLIQMVAVGFDNIRVLIGLFELVPMANEYTKKNLGKYFIIELRSLFKLLEKLSGINAEYGEKEFADYKNAVGELESKYELKGVRDKLGAHLDPDLNLKEYIEYWDRVNKKILVEYWDLTVNHVDEILTKYYPMEKRLYFVVSDAEINGIRIPENMGFVPFEKFEI